MIAKLLMKSLIASAALALAGTSALAANAIGATVSTDGLRTMVPSATDPSFVRGGIAEPGPLPLFDDTGRAYPKGLYFCCYGGTIGGPASQVGQVWQAEAFTPSQNAKVTDIDVAIGYVSGTNGVTISLYSDVGGVPGTQLFSKDATGLKTFGGCCGLAIVKSRNGVRVGAGTQYWIVLSTDSKNADVWAAWNMNSTNQIDPIPAAVNTGSGWSSFSSVPAFSFAVLGDPT